MKEIGLRTLSQERKIQLFSSFINYFSVLFFPATFLFGVGEEGGRKWAFLSLAILLSVKILSDLMSHADLHTTLHGPTCLPLHPV